MAAIAKGVVFKYCCNHIQHMTTLIERFSTSVRSVLQYHEANTEAETVYFSDFIIKINPQGGNKSVCYSYRTKPFII